MNTATGVSEAWALVVVVVVPALIIAAAELDERLRQRRSPLRRAVSTLRNWSLPFFAIWALLVPVLGTDNDEFVVRAASTGLVLSIASASLSVLRVVINGVRNRPRTENRRDVPQLLLALPRLTVILVAGWILIDSIWGVDLSAALTALGVTSLVISFALQDTLSGLASGMLLLSDQPFKNGDWIRVGDTEGKVVDIGWRTSQLRDRNGNLIVVPNSELAGASVTTFATEGALHRVVVNLQVAFVNPPTLAKNMLLDAARSTPGVLSDPPPNVAINQIDDPLMGYEVQMWVDDYAIVPRVKSDFGTLVWYQSQRHDVPLPSPAHDVYLYDGPTASAASVPTPAEIRSLLTTSAVLASLPDADLDLLARSTVTARFARDEVLIESTSSARDLYVIAEGCAQLTVEVPVEGEVVVAELNDGDLVGLVNDLRGPLVRCRATDDCEVAIVEASVVSEVGSRNSEIANALNRMTALRRRRVLRTVERAAVSVRYEQAADVAEHDDPEGED